MKKNKFKTVFRIFSIVLFSLIVTTLLTSTIFARYLTTDSTNSEARVAKWDIDFQHDTSYNSIISSIHLEEGSSGVWGLDITNNSEVVASFSEDSKVKIRLQSPDFHVEHEHNSWDFLVDSEHNAIDNPINFKAYMYNCSLAELEAANGNLGTIKEIEVFNTKDSSDALKFQMIIHEGELYFECCVDVGEKLNATDDFILNIGTGKACLMIFWQVDEVLGSVDTDVTFKSYSLVEKSQSTKYDGTYGEILLIDGVEYVIAYSLHDYFDYLIYSSSLGGEIMITFTDEMGKDYVRRCTKLSDIEKINLTSRTLDNLSIDNINRFIELLEYNEFNDFLEKQSDYSEITGYLSLGLECRIILDIKVEQVD